MKKIWSILSLILALNLLLSACVGGGNGTETPVPTDNPTAEPADPTATPDNGGDTNPTEAPTATPEPSDSTVPVIRFAVCSDTHISSVGSAEAKRLAKLFETAYRYADSQEYKGLDAVVIVGDMTNQGKKEEFDAVKSVIQKNMREGTQLITVMGNHEVNGGGYVVYQDNMDPETRKHVVINGFHFIGISPDDGSANTYSLDTSNWLRDELAIAAADDPNKPIFSFRHHHLQNTVYVSRSWYTPSSAGLKKAMGNYPQIIDFSGDSHGPINNPLSICQDKFTMLGTGTLSYFEMEQGMTGGTLPVGKENAAQYYLVEADAKNRVTILPFNLLTDDFFRTASNTDDPAEQLVYHIDTPSDPASFLYTADYRKELNEAPYFAEGAKLEIADVGFDRATVTLPQAKDDNCIYSYTLDVLEGSAKRKTFKFFSEYYFEPIPDTVSYKVTGLRPGVRYTVKVTPVDAWGKEGQPITAEFSTKEGTLGEYVSKNPVTFKGTFSDFESFSKLTRSEGTSAYGGAVTGDVYGGVWNGNGNLDDVTIRIADGKGYNGSKALAISTVADDHANRCITIFANDENGITTAYKDSAYLRVWVDFTGIDFRKASFGLITDYGELYSTDDIDMVYNQPLYYMAEGTDEWVKILHGDDGCFGAAQKSSVLNFKGWLAVPTRDFGSRSGSGERFQGNYISAVYMYWDIADNSMLGQEFYLDEIAFVSDYLVFENYN